MSIWTQKPALIQLRTSLLKLNCLMIWLKTLREVRYRTFQLRPEWVLETLQALERRMREAAKTLRFEEAARLRDEMRRVEALLLKT